MNKERNKKVYVIVGIIIVILITVGSKAGMDKEERYRRKLIGTWYYWIEESARCVSFNSDDSYVFYNAYYDEYGEIVSLEKDGIGRWTVVTEDNKVKMILDDLDDYVEKAIIEEVHKNRIVLTDENRMEIVTLWATPHM